MTTLYNSSPGSFAKRFGAWFGIGVIGVIAITVASVPTIRQMVAAVPGMAALPLPALLAVSIIQPTIMVAIATALGVTLAPRVGLRSYLVDRVAGGGRIWPALKNDLPLATLLGVLTSVVTIAADVLTRSLLPPLKPGSEALLAVVSHNSVPSVLASLLYGGVTEELLLRWGVMTLLAWLGWKLAQRGSKAPNPAVMWSAIALSALLFGIGHLGATALAYELTPFVVLRTLVLNGVFGLAAGWLYWRRSLEAAMIAHGTFHVVLTMATLVLSATAQ